jgi:carbonic anhydrase
VPGPKTLQLWVAARNREKGEDPFAVVLGCADCRVSPELLFDQGLGDLFVIRVAGSIVDDAIRGSIEYAVEHLGTKLVMVLGRASVVSINWASTHQSAIGGTGRAS